MGGCRKSRGRRPSSRSWRWGGRATAGRTTDDIVLRDIRSRKERGCSGEHLKGAGVRKSKASEPRPEEGWVLNGLIISHCIYHTLSYCQPTLTFDTSRPSKLSSLIPTAGSENPPNPSSPRSRRTHVSVATPIRDACLYVGTKVNALSG
jgi:hypothetical protein